MSTQEISIYTQSFKAGADFQLKQYFAMKLDTTEDQVVLATAGVGDGILQNKPDSGQAAEVRHHGISRNVVDGNATAILIGSLITSDAAGKGVVADSIGDVAYGKALQASTTDGDVIAILMTGPTRIHA